MSRTREGRTWRRLSGLVGAKCNNTCFSLGVSFGGAGLPAAMHRHAAMYEGRGAIVHRSGRSGRRSCRWRGCAASRRPSCSHGASGFSGAGARSESVRAPRIQLSVASHRRHLELEAGAIDRRAATNGMPPDGRNQCRALPNQSCLQRPPPPPQATVAEGGGGGAPGMRRTDGHSPGLSHIASLGLSSSFRIQRLQPDCIVRRSVSGGWVEEGDCCGAHRIRPRRSSRSTASVGGRPEGRRNRSGQCVLPPRHLLAQPLPGSSR